MLTGSNNIKSVAVALIIALSAPIFASAQAPTRAVLYAQKNGVAAAKVTAAGIALGGATAAAAIPGALPVVDLGIHGQGIVKAQFELDLAAAELAEVQNDIFEDVLGVLEKVLYENLKKKILDMVVDQIIGYIQGEGSPRFITDWEGFFNDIVQGVTGDLVKELGLGFLCTPFSLPVRLHLAAGLVPVERFKAKFDCTLDQIVGNIDAFFEDFRNGGWKAYRLAWEPQNNYYGAVWLAWDEQQNQLANKLFAAANEAIANEGWLSVKKCYSKATGLPAEVAPGETSGPGITCTTVTPGKALGSLVEKAIGSDIDFIVNSNDLSTYIAAITNALINRIIKEGVGLLGVTTPSAPQRVGTRDPLGNVIYGPANLPGSVSSVAGQYQNTTGTTKLTVKQQLEAVRDARVSGGASLAQRLNLENNYLSQLRVLRACEERKLGPGGAAATISQITNQLAVVNDIQARLLANQEIVEQYNFAIRELDGLNEAAVVANLAFYENLTGRYGEALQFKQTANNELATATANIPGLISAVNLKIEQCNAR
jgi:hypothetical protein